MSAEKEGLSRVHIVHTIRKCNPSLQDLFIKCDNISVYSVPAPHKFYIGFRYVHPSTEDALEQLERLVPRSILPLPLPNMLVTQACFVQRKMCLNYFNNYFFLHVICNLHTDSYSCQPDISVHVETRRYCW